MTKSMNSTSASDPEVIPACGLAFPIGKMIGYLNPIPVYTFSSLLLLATSVDAEHVVPFVDARRGNAFMGYYRQQNNIFTEVIPDCLAACRSYGKHVFPQMRSS
ncbi:MAG: hypothetical protein MZU97_15505 [Bacillus subtilis]|nr:hypothetical protein [Bacillus subtilis]